MFLKHNITLKKLQVKNLLAITNQIRTYAKYMRTFSSYYQLQKHKICEKYKRETAAQETQSKKQKGIAFKNELVKICTYLSKSADENICGECEQEYSEDETED